MQPPDGLRSQQQMQPAPGGIAMQRGPDLHRLSSNPWHQSHSQDAHQQQMSLLLQPPSHQPSLPAHQQGNPARPHGTLSSMQLLGPIAQQQQRNGNLTLGGPPGSERAIADDQHNLPQQACGLQAPIYGPGADVFQQQQRHHAIKQPMLHGTWQDEHLQQPNRQPLPRMQLAIQQQQLQQLDAKPLQQKPNAIEQQQLRQRQRQIPQEHSQPFLSPANSVVSRIMPSGDPKLQGQQPRAAGSHSDSPSEERPQRDTLQGALQHLRAKQRKKAQHGLVPQGGEPVTGAPGQMHGHQPASLAPVPGES